MALEKVEYSSRGLRNGLWYTGELSFHRHPRANLHGYSNVRIAPEITVTDRRRCAIEAGNALALATSSEPELRERREAAEETWNQEPDR
jgi:hypothetical protein